MFSEDILIFILDESLLFCDGMRDDVVLGSFVVSFEKNVLSGVDFFLFWIYDGFFSIEQLVIWFRIREEKA